MVEYNLSTIKGNLQQIFSMFNDWDNFIDSPFLHYYADGMSKKNEYLQELFDGTDGRIIIDVNKYQNLANDLILADLKNYIDNNLIDDVSKLGASYNFASSLRQAFSNILGKITLNDHRKIVLIEQFSNLPCNGQRFTKILNSVVEVSMLASETIMSEEYPDQLLVKIQNRIVGGKIAQILSAKNWTNKKLVLSIRPEDIFLASYGNNWRSCLHPDGGDYNNGALGYMIGPDAFIGFTAKEEDLARTDFMVPKIWRQVMFLFKDSESPDDNPILLSQKGYPYECDGFSNILNQAVVDKLKWDDGGIIHNSEDYSEKCQNRSKCNEYGFVDIFERSSKISQLRSKQKIYTKTLFIQAYDEFVCLLCGAANNPGTSSGVCDDCDNVEYCFECGEPVLDYDMVYIYDEWGVWAACCPSCADDLGVYSDLAEEIIRADNAIYIEHNDIGWVHESLAVFSDYLDMDILTSNAIWSNALDSYIPEDEVQILFDGSIGHIDSCYKWILDGEYHLSPEDTTSEEWQQCFHALLPTLMEEAIQINNNK